MTKRRIPHVRQSFNWDCGFACIEMALRALGVAPMSCSLQELRPRVPSSSIWTVDLAHVLCDYGIRFRFLTTMPGVNPAYREEAFYRNTIDSDSERVLKLFERAPERDICIEHRSVSSEELVQLVSPQENILMVLVDRRRLYRSAGANGLVESLSQCILSSYIGHYVLVSSYDDAKCGYQIKDPARSSGDFFVAAEDLDAARCSHGTDEDLIVIPWDQVPSGSVEGSERWAPRAGEAKTDATDVRVGSATNREQHPMDAKLADMLVVESATSPTSSRRGGESDGGDASGSMSSSPRRTGD